MNILLINENLNGFCLFSHCSNTNKFISCKFVNGDIKLIENNCPKGLVWNNSRKECLMNHKNT